MKFLSFLSLLLLLLHAAGFSQVSVTHGPVVGAVTPTSARITARTSAAATLSFQLSISPTFSTLVGTASSSPVDTNRFATISVTGLSPNTEVFLSSCHQWHTGHGCQRSAPFQNCTFRWHYHPFCICLRLLSARWGCASGNF